MAELTDRRCQRVLDVATARLRGVTVVMENLADPHNVAAVLRTAEALGVDRLHVVEQPNRWEKNKAIAKSADQWVDVVRHQGLARCLGDLSAEGFVLAAADVGSGCVPLSDLPCDRPLALVFGSEHAGLSKRALSLTDIRFTIPMHGFVESFNVSVSAAVTLFDVTQRRRAFLRARGDLDLEEAAARAEQYLRRALKSPELIAELERKLKPS